MVRRNLGLPHRLISKNFNCVIWVKNKFIDNKNKANMIGIVNNGSISNLGEENKNDNFGKC